VQSRAKPSELVVRVAAMLLCGIAVAALIAVLGADEPEDIAGKAFLAALMLILFSPLGLAGIVLTVRRPAIAWFGYATTLVAFVAFVILTKQVWDGNLPFFTGDWEVPGTALVVSLTCGQVSLILAWARSGSLVRGLGSVAAVVVAAIGILVVLGIIADIDVSERIYGVLAILYLLAIALLPLFTLGGRERS
jgi:hypothetical protein